MILIKMSFYAFSIYEDLIETSRRVSYLENNVKITRIKSRNYDIKVPPLQFIVSFFIQRVLEECPHDITLNLFFFLIVCFISYFPFQKFVL